MAKADLYATLGVAKDADEDTIRKAFRKLARQYHPDVNQDDPAKAEKFKEVSFANEVLSDSEKRKLYDEFGVQGLDPNFNADQARAARNFGGGHGAGGFSNFGGDFDLDDLLGRLYGRGGRGGRANPFGGFGFGQAGPEKGPDAEGNVSVDFLDAVRGGKITIQFRDKGALNVTIPAGADEGTRIRLGGQGGAGRGGGPAGDLYLTLHVRPHTFFRREGADLHLDLPVTIGELVRGGSVAVPTPDGAVQMKIPAGSKNGRKMRLTGKGASIRARRGEAERRGDLYAHLRAVLPEDSEQLRAIADEIDPLYNGTNVRAALGV